MFFLITQKKKGVANSVLTIVAQTVVDLEQVNIMWVTILVQKIWINENQPWNYTFDFFFLQTTEFITS